MAKELNIEAFSISLFNQMVKIENEKNQAQQLTGSIAEKNIVIIDKLEKPKGKNYFGIEKSNNSIFAILDDERVGFMDASFSNFLKLVSEVHRKYVDTHHIKSVEEKCFDWMIDSYSQLKQNGRINGGFETYVTDHLNAFKKDFKYSCKILNLDISKSFKLGKTEYWYMEKDYWTKRNTKGEGAVLDKEFGGNIFVSYQVLGKEGEKGKEDARAICEYSMDVLKTISYGLVHPHEPIYFEIDTRCKFQPHGIGLSEELGSKSPTISMNSNIKNTILDVEFIDWMTHPERSVLIETIDSKSQNELIQLVIDSVKRYSKALSMSNPYDKIVAIMTVWESLLLPNDKAPIKQTLLKYGPKLILDDLKQRRDLKALLNKYYSIRSNYLHHSIESKLDEKETFDILSHTLSLIIVILHSSKKFNSKKDLLNMVDDAMDSSFSIGQALR